MIVLALGLALSGFGALCLSNPIHHRDLLGRLPSSRASLALRLAGWALLGLSLWAVLAGATTVAVGIVYWLGLLTGAALTIAFGLTYRQTLLALARRIAALPASILVQARRAFESPRP